MRFLSVCSALAVAAGVCCITFSNASIDAHALTGGTYLPEAAARSYFGDEIDCTYYTSSGRQSATFRYYGTDTFDSLPAYSNALSNYNQDVLTYCTNASFLVYSADLTGVVNDPTQIVVDLTPQYSIFDTSQIHCAIGLTGTNYSTSAYISASWDWYFSGDTVHSEAPLNEYGYGLRAQSHSLQSWFNLVPVNLESQSTTSGYSLRAVFPVADSQCYLIIGCPYVSLGSSGESGIGSLSSGSGVTTSSSSGSGGQDLEETNGLLGGILDWLSGLGDMLLGLFIPDSDFLDAWCAAMQELLEEHLGGAYDAIEMMVDLVESLYHPSTVGVISCPTINLPGGLVLGGWTLDLKYNTSGMNTLYTALAWIIDFLCTCYFLTACRKKVEIILNPDSEVVSNDN